MKQVVLASCLLSISAFGLAQDWKKDLNEARRLYKEKKYPESLEKYKSAQKQAPKDIDLSDEMAQSSYKANEFEKAEKIYHQSSSKKAGPDQKARTYHNIGNALMKQKKYTEAVEAYKESLRNNPNDEETRYNLSEAMKQQKSQQDQQQDQNQQNQKNQNQPNPQNQTQQNQNQNQQQNQSKNNNKGQNQQEQGNGQPKSQLTDKKTERMLDELAKKEMETKKKLDGNKGKYSKNTSGKDW